MYRYNVAGYTRTMGADHPDTLTARAAVVFAYGLVGKHGRAIRTGLAAVAHCQRVIGADHPTTLLTRHNLASS
jgi:hypothetical protein